MHSETRQEQSFRLKVDFEKPSIETLRYFDESTVRNCDDPLENNAQYLEHLTCWVTNAITARACCLANIAMRGSGIFHFGVYHDAPSEQ